jgi:hypothetical protein
LPKFTAVGATVNCPAVVVVVPEPLRGMFTSGPETNTYPPLVPVDFGAKVRFTDTLCPGFKVTGNVRPLAENPVPVI